MTVEYQHREAWGVSRILLDFQSPYGHNLAACHRYSGLLSTNDEGQENKRLLGECVQDIRAVEGRLAKTYIEVSSLRISPASADDLS